MSDEPTTNTPPEETPQEAPETIQQAWEKQAITTEDVAGTKPAEESTPADRQLVAPSIRDLIRENTPKETSVLAVTGSRRYNLRDISSCYTPAINSTDMIHTIFPPCCTELRSNLREAMVE